MLTSFYVYQYLRDDGTPYYIGKGQKDRITRFHGTVKVPNKDKRNKIAQHLLESEVLLLERKLTNYYGLLIDGTGILENKIHGGNISPRGMLGKKHSQETKLRISQTITGTVKTPEQRENYKKPKSAEHKEKIRQANLGRKDDGRYIKIGHTKSKQKWYTNGITTKMCEPGKEPVGFVKGRK